MAAAARVTTPRRRDQAPGALPGFSSRAAFPPENKGGKLNAEPHHPKNEAALRWAQRSRDRPAAAQGELHPPRARRLPSR